MVDFFFGKKYVVDLFLTPYSDRIRLGIGSRDFCVYIYIYNIGVEEVLLLFSLKPKKETSHNVDFQQSATGSKT